MNRASAAAIGFLIVTVAARAAPVPTHLMPKGDPICYPLVVGDKSVHQLANGEITFTVTKVEKLDGRYRVTLDAADSSTNAKYSQTSIVSPLGVELVEHGSLKVEPSIWWLKLPHAENNAWSSIWTPTGTKYNFKTTGWEIVEVPAGRIRAVRVERTESQDGNDLGTTVYWYAPRYGCIKIAGRSPARALKSFTPGKE